MVKFIYFSAAMNERYENKEGVVLDALPTNFAALETSVRLSSLPSQRAASLFTACGTRNRRFVTPPTMALFAALTILMASAIVATAVPQPRSDPARGTPTKCRKIQYELCGQLRNDPEACMRCISVSWNITGFAGCQLHTRSTTPAATCARAHGH